MSSAVSSWLCFCCWYNHHAWVLQIRSASVAVTTFGKSHVHKQTTVMILMPAPPICFSINNRYMVIVMVNHRFQCEAQLTAGIALAYEGIAFASVQISRKKNAPHQ
jgi:hypothetical protein